MTNQHPITPPPELAKQWAKKYIDTPYSFEDLVNEVARWGADQQLEACCEWFVRDWTNIETADKLRAAMRPKPPSLKEQALAKLAELEGKLGNDFPKTIASLRGVLEQLPND